MPVVVMTRERSRVVIQYLEGGGDAGRVDPAAAVERLRRAAATLPVDDLCLGWNLDPAQLDAVVAVARDLGITVWLWHPLLSGDGRYAPGAHRAVGPSGHRIPAFRDLPELAFDCPVDPEGRRLALERLDAGMRDGSWDGVLLDKIRWPSPFADPARDLGCWCPHCERSLRASGMDPATVRRVIEDASTSPAGRVELAVALLGGPAVDVVAKWLEWRCAAITGLVAAAAGLAAGCGLRVALDVFAPSLARAVGQDLGALAPMAELTKSMLYLGTHGPAGMAHELLGLERWLVAGGVDAPADVLAEVIGHDVPGPDELGGAQLPTAVLEREMERLIRVAGDSAAVGIDAVRMRDIAVLDDGGLRAAVRHVAARGVSVVVSWDLWHITDARLRIIAEALAAHPGDG